MLYINVKTDIPVRLDRYIRRYYPSLTQGIIEKSLRTGCIQLNNQKSKAHVRVNRGDYITFSSGLVIEDNNYSSNNYTCSIITLAKKLLSEYLIHTSPEFIVINKPHNLAVQGGSKINLSIDEALSYLNQVEGHEYKIVHRLDKPTSGLLIIAKGYLNAIVLSKAFREYAIKKLYSAIVSGIPNSLKDNLVHYIGQDSRGPRNNIVRELQYDGKKAETYYEVIQFIKGQSLINFSPLTGRKHQIRFHAKFLGCPIIGDNKYGGKENSRMLLHARKIIIKKSVFGREIVIKSDLPREFDL